MGSRSEIGLVAPDQQRALFESAEEIAQLGTWEWAPELGKLLWSANLFRIFGLTPGELTPTVAYVFERVHPDDRRRVELAVSTLGLDGTLDRLDYRIIHADGLVRHLQATVVALERPERHPRRIVGAVQDVTDRQWAEREIAARSAVSEALDA